MRNIKELIQKRVGQLGLNPAEESSLVEEITQHLEDRRAELLNAGVSEDETYQRLAAELADMYPMQKAFAAGRTRDDEPAGKETSHGNFFENLWRDLRYQCRAMRRNPLFALFIIVTLGLGIGANTTVFTLINTIILHALPVKDPSGLVAVTRTETKNTAKSKSPLPMSYPDLKDYQAGNDSFTSLAGYTSPQIVTLLVSGASQRMFTELVTGNYFKTLGLTPVAGRFFSSEADRDPGAHPVAVMNYATWQSRFGGDPHIAGKVLRLNNLLITVIGVAPPRFIGVNLVFGPDLWIPASMAEQLFPVEMRNALSARDQAAFQGVARLKPGVSRSRAQANLASIASALAREYPEADEGHSVAVMPVTDAISSTPILFGSIVLAIVVGIVLLIACSNVANLLMARSAARRQEMAVRMAIGASRSRLVRQLLTETIFLGLLSGIVGFGIGYGALRVIWSFMPPEVSANLFTPKLDATVFVFTLVIALATGLIFGTLPALRTARVGVAESLKEESHSVGRSHRRVSLANSLLAGQVAVSFLLLVTAALFLRSIQRAYAINPGFQTAHLATFMTNPAQAGYSEAQTKSFYKEVRDRVSALPGIDSASWSLNMPLWGRVATGVQVEGRQPRSKAQAITTILNTVDLNYFETTGIGINKGRAFTAIDQADSAPVALINEKMARDFWPRGDALGKRIRLPGESTDREIIGIASNANYTTLGEPPQPCIYEPLTQHYSGAMTLYVRSKGDPQGILLPVQHEIRSVAPRLYLGDIRTGRKIVDQALFTAKAGVGLLSAFGLLALALACIGLYGIMAYSVNQRQREIGVRMALGAAQNSVVRLILRQGMVLVAIGVAIGFIISLATGRLLARMLYGIGASDPFSVIAAAVVLLVVALLACSVPAFRASRIDPLSALREG